MKLRNHIHCFCVLALIITIHATKISAQDMNKIDSTLNEPEDGYGLENDIAKYPLKPPDLSSPRATLTSFLSSMNRSYHILMEAHRLNTERSGFIASDSIRQMVRDARILFERGIYCLNLSKIPDAYRENFGFEGALKLKEILDRVELPSEDQIPDTGAVYEVLEDNTSKGLHRWRIPNTDIVIARVEEGPREGMFLFSPETVSHLDKYFRAVRALPYKSEVGVTPDYFEFYSRTPGRLLPPKWHQWLPAWANNIYLSQTLWQWGGLVGLIILALIIAKLLYRWLHSTAPDLSEEGRLWRRVLLRICLIGLIIAVYHLLDEYFNISGYVIVTCRIVATILALPLLSAAVFGLGMAVAEKIISSPRIDPKGIHASYIRALFMVLGFLAAAIILVFGLSKVGVTLVPLLTGVGIGGFAIALAARPTLENIIASFTIFADKPYQVGQRILLSGEIGVVESIGLRSTRIRLLSGHLTAVPNEKMAAMGIENMGLRPYIRRDFNINIIYGTPPDQIRRAVEILKEILAVSESSDSQPADSEVNATDGSDEARRPSPSNKSINRPDLPPKVYFNEFNSDSLNLRVIYWFHPPEYWDYLEHAEWINFQIKERFNAEGIDFAFPTQTLHMAGDEEHPLTINQIRDNRNPDN